jgi:flagellar protein FlgJ
MDKLMNDTSVYNDVQSLEHLKYSSRQNPLAAKKEIAKQFESILMQQMLKSMRDANKVFDNDLFSSDQMDFYQDMFDKQLTLSLSEHGLGVANIISKNIEDHYGQPGEVDADDAKKLDMTPGMKLDMKESAPIVKLDQEKKIAPAPVEAIHSREDFIAKLWNSAKEAAKSIGVNPKVLLAQAALETNWGRNIIPGHASETSYNLFNIKAGLNWTKPTSTANVVEQQEGVMVSEKAKFKNYDSYQESFHDYVNLLKTNSRYSKALENAADPKQFITTLQQSGFATDQHYSEKVLGILTSKQFNKLTAVKEFGE